MADAYSSVQAAGRSGQRQRSVAMFRVIMLMLVLVAGYTIAVKATNAMQYIKTVQLERIQSLK